MARAKTRTWLPLERWAEILGVHPFNFNQLYHADISPETRTCADVWYQEDWQNAVNISRESLAIAIQDAERKIANYVGYFLLPDWVADERVRTIRPSRPELYPADTRNIRGQAKSIQTRWKNVISGGIRASSLIESGSAIARSDDDGDLFDELCTVSVATTVTDEDEIRVYYHGESGDPDWEVRPITVSISGGTATITFKVWQVVKKSLLLALKPSSVNAATDSNFETTVDVYRVYNDPSQMATLLWEPQPDCDVCGGTGCAACSFSSQTACLLARDRRLGFMAYNAASWDADDEEYDSKALSVARDPDQIRLWYYSGWRSDDPRTARPDSEMDPYWEKVVAYFAAALLDRPIAACNNAQEFVEHWRVDRARVGTDRSYQVAPKDLDNPFGTTEGALYAWMAVTQEGRKVHA